MNLLGSGPVGPKAGLLFSCNSVSWFAKVHHLSLKNAAFPQRQLQRSQITMKGASRLYVVLQQEMAKTVHYR